MWPMLKMLRRRCEWQPESSSQVCLSVTVSSVQWDCTAVWEQWMFFFSPLKGFFMELDAAPNVLAPYGSPVWFCSLLFFLFFSSFFLKGLFTQCSSLSSEVFAVLIRITYTDALFVPFNMKISCRIHFSKKKRKGNSTVKDTCNICISHHPLKTFLVFSSQMLLRLHDLSPILKKLFLLGFYYSGVCLW